eukprot:scaffold104618_cov30-Cyclotella_meneghiniana.AAC.1
MEYNDERQKLWICDDLHKRGILDKEGREPFLIRPTSIAASLGCKKGLLYISLARDRWEWDEEKILSEKIPDDVAMFFVATIDTLVVDVKLALSTLSCFGNSVNCEVIHAIEADLGGPEAVQEQEHYSMIARYNLVAGKSAVEKSEFASAFNYF